jgi:predicted HD phosphohydrolase
MFKSLEEIEDLYARRGGLSYGEDVTQLEHALQCAGLAQAQDHAPAQIAAALLHDVGHLFVTEESVIHQDARHEALGARALSGLFDAAVCGPVALHVAAKRYLCFAEPAYRAALSPASQVSLQLQGGAFNAAAAAAFERRPWWREAVALRRIDDTGKALEPACHTFTEYRPLLERLMNA